MSALGWYFLKLIIMLPLVGGMAFGCLWLYRKYQPGMIGGQANRSVKLLDALPMGTFGKLAVVERKRGSKAVKVRRRVPDGEPVKGYYPAVVAERDWWAAQSALSARDTGGRKPTGLRRQPASAVQQ